MEYECTAVAKKSLEGLRYTVIILVRDGVYFACPDSRCAIRDFALLRTEILESRSIEVSLNDIRGEKIDIVDPARLQTVVQY